MVGDTDVRFHELVLKIVCILHTHLAQLDLFWQIISSFLLTGGSCNGGGGTGPSNDVVEPEGESRSGSPSPPCPSLVSLQSSWLDSPTLNTPTNPSGINLTRVPLEKDDWLRSVLLSCLTAVVEDGGNTGLPGSGGPVWDMGSRATTGGGDRDVPNSSEPQHSGLPEL